MKQRRISCIAKLNGWLFAVGDPAALASLRIVFCTLAFLVFVIQAPYLFEYYGQGGLLSVEALDQFQAGTWSFRPLDDSSFTQLRLVYGVVLLSAVLGCVGLFTRAAMATLFFGMLVLQNRNPLILNSGDVLLRLVIFYLALSRCGAAWSLDALWRNKLRQSIPLWPQRLIQIQIALVYFSATWSKMQGALWREGTVTWYVSRIESLQRFPLPEFLISETASQLFTWSTLFIELALCTLVWFKPYRSWVLLGGLLLHLGIEYQLNIPFFGWITVSCYLSHYSGQEIRAFRLRLQKSR